MRSVRPITGVASAVSDRRKLRTRLHLAIGGRCEACRIASSFCSSGASMHTQMRFGGRVRHVRNRTIRVDYLARVEGEGSLYIKIKDGAVKEAEFGIFEPPRFFEAFLRGRNYSEAPDITARICGICPVAYQMSSIHAMEQAFGVSVDPRLRSLRRLLYCGEWIE